MKKKEQISYNDFYAFHDGKRWDIEMADTPILSVSGKVKGKNVRQIIYALQWVYDSAIIAGSK